MNWKVLLAAGTILLSGTIYAKSPHDDSVILSADGTYVDIILHNMIQVRDYPDPGDDYRGSSIDPADEFPSDVGYVFLRTNTYGPWRRDVYATPDAINLVNALSNGGMIILNPGTYYFSARSSWYLDDVWSRTSLDYLPFDAEGKDFVLRGAEVDKNGPMAKIVTDQFLHMGADPRWLVEGYMYYPSYWHQVRAVNQVFESIHFDNSEYMAFREGRSSTLIGQVGKANLTLENCKFTGGGLTFHTVGSLVFKDNTVDALYGVHLTSGVFYSTDWSGNTVIYVDTIADADALISGNKIRTEGIGIYIDRNSYLTPDLNQTRTMKIIGNEVEFSDVLGIGIEFTPGDFLIKKNKITNIPYTGNPASYYGVFGGIGISGGATDAAIQPQEGGMVANNEITLHEFQSVPHSAIALFGRGKATVRANNISGTSNWPIWVSIEPWQYGGEANSNLIVDNELKMVTLKQSGWHPSFVPAAHIFFDSGADYNVVSGGGAAGNKIIVYDLVRDLLGGETHNVVIGSSH